MTELRTDARRNRKLVLEVAQATFAAEGVGVPLAEIARLAGVGAGTIHRHFPSKQALIEAVVLVRIEQLVAEARRLATRDNPGPAFFEFFALAVEQIGLNKALCAAFEADTGVQFQMTPAAGRAFRDALGELLRRAQDAGAVRADLDAEDVAAIAAGCVTMERRRGPTGRMTALVSEVLRPAGVTKQRTRKRNETGSPTRDETPHCELCGAPVHPARTGRRARFCGPACRQKAHRRRHPSGT